MDPIVQEPMYKRSTRTQTVKVPGQKVITQPVIQEYYKEKEIHHVQNPVVKRIPVQRPVPVPTPVLNKVPVIRKIPVPIANKKKRGTKIMNETNVHVHMPK